MPHRERLLGILHRIEDGIVALLLTIMIVLAATQILLRNLFDLGLAWADPLLRLLVLWVGLAGAMVATRSNKHIRIDALSRWLPPGVRCLSDRLTQLFAALVCGMLAWHSARFVWHEAQDGLLLFDALPAWVAELILPLGFGVMTLRFLLQTLKPVAPETRP